MTTKQEFIEAVRRSEERVIKTFSNLSEEQLATRIHDDEGDHWNAKQILAHLANRTLGYERWFRRAETGEAPAGFNLDEFNRERVNERMDRSVPELLAEFRRVHDNLILRIEGAPEPLLNKEIQGPRGMAPLLDVLMLVGPNHNINHAADVERTLGLS